MLEVGVIVGATLDVVEELLEEGVADEWWCTIAAARTEC